jgi:triphosphoribosyl-dephospho-CoA synthase
MNDPALNLSVGRIVTLACLLEVTAPKPGNVHRGADFEDVTFSDFAVSAVVVGEVFDRNDLSIGDSVVESIVETSRAVGTNTNLGIVLLLAPLVAAAKAKTEPGKISQANVSECLLGLSTEEGGKIFRAIRLAKPGGMGQSDQLDLNRTEGPVDLMAAMKVSENRDAIARQYVNGFVDVFDQGQRLLKAGRQLFADLNSAIVYAHVAWMAERPDTLIARKCGKEVAVQAQVMAQKVVDSIPQATVDAGARLSDDDAQVFFGRAGELDFWLRSDGHRRNPGTTADLIAATLFVAIYNGQLRPPFR